MVRESEALSKRKRKGSKLAAVEDGEKKRPRSDKRANIAVEGNLVNILTGRVDTEVKKDDKGELDVVNHSDCDKTSAGSEVEKKGQDKTEPTDSSRLHWPPVLSEAHSKKIKVTVLLENANLEALKQNGRSGNNVLLNCDDHRHILKKNGREVNEARPDITHQCLLTLMDSPLNKSGRLKVYVRTAKNVLIEIHPQTRIPRTIKRFSGLMVELLEKFKVRGTSGSTPLLKVIRNPMTSHLAVGTRKIVCTYNTDNVIDIRTHAANMAKLVVPKKTGVDANEKIDEDDEDNTEDVNVLYVVGAMASGKIEEDWADEYICVSEFPLSASTVCSRITYAYESLFGIL